jgi:hypothetical protein
LLGAPAIPAPGLHPFLLFSDSFCSAAGRLTITGPTANGWLSGGPQGAGRESIAPHQRAAAHLYGAILGPCRSDQAAPRCFPRNFLKR